VQRVRANRPTAQSPTACFSVSFLGLLITGLFSAASLNGMWNFQLQDGTRQDVADRLNGVFTMRW
jgi:hypothetical protein